MIQEINDRRSIRSFKSNYISKPLIEEIIKAGSLAPSSKNRQPWKFIVVTGDSKTSILSAMENGLDREKNDPLLPSSSAYLKGAKYTLGIMKQAPTIIFIVNMFGFDINSSLTPEQQIYEICNAQSIGAAIENMSLTATNLGLGSLWICDTFFANRELCRMLNTDGELFAALAIGYANEAPSARPRKELKDIV